MLDYARMDTVVGSQAIFVFIRQEDISPLGELATAKFLTEYVQQILGDDIYVHQNLGGNCWGETQLFQSKQIVYAVAF